MRKICITLIIITILPLSNAFGQNKLTITGNVQGSVGMFYYVIGDKLTEIRTDENGNFSLEITAPETPVPLSFVSISPKMKLIDHTPTLWIAKNCTIELNANTQPTQYKTSYTHPFQKASETIERAGKRKKLKRVKQNIDKAQALYLLNEIKQKYNKHQLQELALLIPDSLRQNNDAQQILGYLKAKNQPKLKKGGTLANFSLPDKDQKQTPLFKNNGNYTIISLLESGCPYSTKAIEILANLYKDKKQPVNFVTIFTDKTYEDWQNHRADIKSKITWPNLWDPDEFIKTHLGLTMIPTFYIIDTNRRVTTILKGLNEKTIGAIKSYL